MVRDLLILALLGLAAAITGIVREARGRVAAHGLLKLFWRWHTGQPWHGRPLTDAGWLRPATDRKAFTPTGHAPRFHHLPRWRRAISRTGRSVTIVFLFLIWVNNRPAGELAALFAVLSVAGYWGWRAWRRWDQRKHRRTWMEPLHLVAAPLVGIPRALPASSWLAIEPDRSKVVAQLPPGYNPDGKEKERLVTTFATKLGIEAPEARWMLAGPEPRLELCAAKPPPARVTLADVREALDRAKDDDLVWGLGRHHTVVASSLSNDSPHVGLSMGSGAGKSVTARALLAPLLHRGAIGMIIDRKMISHQWAEGLPNVKVYRRPPEIHEALCWLGGDPTRDIIGEVERRNEVALAGADIEGNVNAIVGPRLIVICEELNVTISRLRAHWARIRAKDDPVRSPALDALDEASFMGRQVLTNIVYIGQRLSDKATGGGGDVRENIGVIAFGRWRASTWKMLAPDFPMPPKNLTPGRIQVVSDQVREAQVPFLAPREARQLALSGKVTPLPYGIPGAPRVTGTEIMRISAPDLGDVTVTGPSEPPAVTGWVTLSEAAGQHIVSRSHGALRTAKHRDAKLPETERTFPAPKDQRGLADLYDPLELAEWDARSR